ncbi:Sybindin-like protein [Fimicolochytrium jonesii]|uniref:Sybindin-like protein n=1 Tax=Fimicolochytrium jonesii TaxID=1396493 RepID=UPI0022FE27A8|nr:Sybindin-like protein [Fimicolochytrium jonesii]KAI8823422.1 Sybindin-like protein [Fimicolochytrium jonesii]
MLHALLIINKAGGLIYNRDFTDGLAKLTTNEYLVMAGTFHGVHAITSRISPVPGSSGMEVLEADTFRIFCFQTLTGVKFLLITDPLQPYADNMSRKVYELYGDFVMKNPFYNPEMPIRIELFDANVQKLAKQLNAGG